LEEAGGERLQPTERNQGVTQHGLKVEVFGRLFEDPQSLGEIGVESEELVQKFLRDLLWVEIELVESAGESEQVEPSGLEPLP
jgi:hypothetical protein